MIDNTANASTRGTAWSMAGPSPSGSRSPSPVPPSSSSRPSGITRASTNCSPLRMSSRNSIRAWASTLRGHGALPGRGA